MTTIQTIAAYKALLDGINASLSSVDAQMDRLHAEYENLMRLHEAVSGDIQAMAASIEGGVRS